MIGSKEHHRKLSWIAETGLICLGAGGLFLSGCSTATVADARAPANSNQQVAATKQTVKGTGKETVDASKPASRKSTKQVASKNPAGKARVSDLDPETRVQIAARSSQKMSSEAATLIAASQSRPASADVARAPEKSKSRVTIATQTANQTQGLSQKSPADGATMRPPTSAVEPATSSSHPSNPDEAGAIRQTSGDDGSYPSAGRLATAAAGSNNPVITPGMNERQAERSDDGLASNHERRRADRLMQRAYTMFETGYREESLRLASVALELENSKQAVYQPGEERPSDFIALLKATGGNNGLPSAATSPQPGTAGESNYQVSAAAADSLFDRRSSTAFRGPAGTAPVVGGNSPVVASVFPQSTRDQHRPANSSPHFTTGDQSSLQSAANAEHVEVPLATTLRNADVNIVTVDDNKSMLAANEKSDGEVSLNRSQPPKTLEAKSTDAAAAVATGAGDVEVELEPIAEVTVSNPTSQLTIASIIGLLTGVGGMVGLGWWRRQERQHYAAGK